MAIRKFRGMQRPTLSRHLVISTALPGFMMSPRIHQSSYSFLSMRST